MKIGIVGCAGRMGRMLINEVLAFEGASLVGGTEHGQSEHLGADLGSLVGKPETGVIVTPDAEALIAAADVIIDFTIPEATRSNAELASANDTAMVIGTTGLSASDQKVIALAASRVAIVQAANYSVGVNLMLGMTEQAAAILGDDMDIEIVEMHHRHKVDAPSGTALALGDAAAFGRGVNLGEVSARARDGHTGARKPGDIGFASLRGGDVAGEHTVIFAGEGERLEITHKAGTRQIFAVGAVRAASWTLGREPGLYSMRDVLGLK